MRRGSLGCAVAMGPAGETTTARGSPVVVSLTATARQAVTHELATSIWTLPDAISSPAMSEIELPPYVVTLSPEALFRCYVVMLVLGRELLGDTRPEAIARALDEPHRTPNGLLRVVSRRTLYRWLRAHESGGPAALEPTSRTVACKALPESFVEFLRVQKKDDPFVSVPEVIRRARESGTLRADDLIDRVTVYRAAKRLDLPLTSRVAKRYSDMRRFAYPHRMRMVLVDGKHFRAGVGRLKRVALFFIDDCSRRVLAVVVGPSESTRLTLRGLLLVIRHFGLMDILYFDHGPGFDSGDTHAVCRKLGVFFIHGRKRYPEGHGKIEAFNKTAHHDVLRGLLRPEVDADYGSLELRLRHYIEHQYSPRVHESLEGLSPLQRWDRDDRPLRFLPTMRTCIVASSLPRPVASLPTTSSPLMAWPSKSPGGTRAHRSLCTARPSTTHSGSSTRANSSASTPSTSPSMPRTAGLCPPPRSRKTNTTRRPSPRPPSPSSATSARSPISSRHQLRTRLRLPLPLLVTPTPPESSDPWI